MLTLEKLLKLTPSKVVYRASHPRIRIINDKKKEDYRVIYARVALGNVESTGDTYSCLIECHGQKAAPHNFFLKPTSLVLVHCSCPYFTYHLEYALKIQGSSRFENSNGRYPKIKNKSLYPYLCKHLYAATTAVLLKEKRKS